MKKNISKYWYVSRDRVYKLDPLFCEYNVSDSEMKIDKEGMWEGYDECYCPDIFERITGIKLKLGQQKKINKKKLRELLEEVDG